MIPSQQLLLRDGIPIPLGARAFDLLTVLVRRSGELVSKDDLIAAAWPDVFVHESNLKVNMYSLRRALGDTQKRPTYVATVPGRGYRFVAAVETSQSVSDDKGLSAQSLEPGRLPEQVDVIGRDTAVAEILSKLRAERLVTVVGAGGIGKTTVAIEAARTLRTAFADGVRFVDLSSVDNPALVATALIASIGIRGDMGDPLTTVLEYLRERRMLVILDNCEHVLAAASIFARRFTSEAGTSTLLATSREPLGIPAEQLFWLSPLELPEGETTTTAAASQFSAIGLFARRASDWADYQIVDADCAAVSQICRSLGGLPLAIEIAAANLEAHTPQQLLAMLGGHLSFRRDRQADVPSRQETLLATIDWSFKLLSQDEAMIFRLVSVFADSFELEDVIAIGSSAGLTPVSVIVGLGGLVAKSMLTAQVLGSGLRYRLLDSTRRYATQRRQEDPINANALLSHAQRMLFIFEQSEGEWDWRESDDWVGRYLERLADLRSALAWAFGDGSQPELGIRLTVAAIPLWFEASLVSEARTRVELALEVAGSLPCDDLLKAKLACARAWNMAYARRVLPALRDAWLLAIEFARRAGDVGYQLRAKLGLSLYLLETGSIQQSIDSLEELNDLSARNRDWSVVPEFERSMALARAYRGHLMESKQALDRLAHACPRPDRRSRMAGFQVDRYIGIRCHLPFVAWLTGQPDYAAATSRDAVEVAGALGHRVSQSNAIAMGGLPVSLWNGDEASLDRYVTQLKSLVELENIAVWIPYQMFYDAALRDMRGEPDAVPGLQDAVEAIFDGRLCSRIGMKLGILADAFARQSRLDEAGNAIARAFYHQELQGEVWCRCELGRIEANIEGRSGHQSLAEKLLQSALEEARAIHATSFELRIASDLARLYIGAGRREEAIQILDPVYKQFSEGFATKDLVAASSILRGAAELAS